MTAVDHNQIPAWRRDLAVAGRGALAGMLIGIPHLHLFPCLAVCGFAGVLVLAREVFVGSGCRRAALLLLPAYAVAGILSGSWAWFTAKAYLGPSLVPVLAAAVGLLVGDTLCRTIPALVLHHLLGRRAFLLWFPTSLILGEKLRAETTHIPIDDFLYGQTGNPFVLRALALTGWYPTLFAALFLATLFGVLFARRALRPILLSIGTTTVLLAALPRIPAPQLDALDGVGAVYMEHDRLRPASAPPGVDLLVWPEALPSSVRLSLAEGLGPQGVTYVPPAIGTASHLLGAVTRVPRGIQNAAVALDSHGSVLGVRAKIELMPPEERKLFGLLGKNTYRPGSGIPILAVGRHLTIPLICLEVYRRDLVSAGKRAGGQLLTILASDAPYQGSGVAKRQVHAALVMRSVEFRLPAVRAVDRGSALIILSDGTVAARSPDGETGSVAYFRDRGAVDFDDTGVPRAMRAGTASPSPGERRDRIAVLWSQQTPSLRPRCLPGRCELHAVESFQCREQQATTVIVSGDGVPPKWLGMSAEALAGLVACFRPELVVLDTCFGATTSLLEPLSRAMPAHVVAAASLVPPGGFTYDEPFFTSPSIATRLASVKLGRHPLYRGRPDRAELASIRDRIERASSKELEERLASFSPTLVRIDSLLGEVLVPIDWRRARRQ